MHAQPRLYAGSSFCHAPFSPPLLRSFFAAWTEISSSLIASDLCKILNEERQTVVPPFRPDLLTLPLFQPLLR